MNPDAVCFEELMYSLRKDKVLTCAGFPWSLETCNLKLQEGLFVFCPEIAAHTLEGLQGSFRSSAAPQVLQLPATRLLFLKMHVCCPQQASIKNSCNLLLQM
jgi:hypothetical protein